MPLPHDPGPHWGEVGIHGLHRQREWDVLVTVEAPSVAGGEAWFVVLADGRVIVEDGDRDPAALVAALTLRPPYRAHGVRRDGALWVVAASGIETFELPVELEGDTIELAWDGFERTARIDGTPTFAGVEELERLARSRHDRWVVRADRIDGRVWEVSISPL